MRKLVVATLWVALVAACDGGGGGGYCHKDGYDFGDSMLELYDWLPGGDGLLRQAERTVVTDAVGELVDYSAKTLQNPRVPGSGQDIVSTAISSRYMSAADLQLFASRFGFGSGVTMYSGAQAKQPGEYVFLSVEHVAETPLATNLAFLTIAAPDRRFQYGAVFDGDSSKQNNWPGIAPFDCDLFVGTDSWYQVSKAPNEAPVLTHQMIDGTQISNVPTGACAIAYRDSIIWMIPKSEFPERNFLPGFRATAFESASDYGQTSGDFSIDDNPPRLDPLATVNALFAARNMLKVELDVRYVATKSDFVNDIGIDLDFLGALEVDTASLDDTAVANDTPENTIVRTSASGGAKDGYNYVPFGSVAGSYFPLAFKMQQPDRVAVFARTPGDVGIPYIAPRFGKQAASNGIDYTVPFVLGSDPTRGDLMGSYLNGLQYDALLQQLAADSNVRMISAPRVTTLNGQTAAIQSLNYRTPITNLQPSVRYLFEQRDQDAQDADTGFQLQITPKVTFDGRIQLGIRPAEAAAIRTSKDVRADNEDFGILLPSIITKDIMSVIVLDSGETVVIGGLMRPSETEIEQGVPWLNKIPVLSSLFSSMKDYDEDDKLMIFITPHLVFD